MSPPNSQANSQERPSSRTATTREHADQIWHNMMQQHRGNVQQQEQQQEPEERAQENQVGQPEEEDTRPRRNSHLEEILQARRAQQEQELQSQAPRGTDEVQIINVFPGTNAENEVRVWRMVTGNQSNESQVVFSGLQERGQ